MGLFSWNMLLQREIRALQGKVQSLQAPPESRMVAMKDPGVSRGAQAELIILADNRAFLAAEDMPPVPEDKTFQIWVIEGDVPKPSGLLEPKEGPVAVVVKRSLYGADAVAVSVEPNGGSPKPTADPMLTAKL